MAGYDYWNGMSNNAVDAYSNGIVPHSKLRASHVSHLGITLKKAKDLIKDGRWYSSEYHHSSKFYNEVDFYDVDVLRELLEDEPEILTENNPKPQSSLDEIPVYGSFTIFSGSGKHIRKAGEQDFTGILKGDWIHLDGGGRKKASGNHINYHYNYKAATANR